MLEFSITSLRYPTVEPVRLARATQFTGGQVIIPQNEMRTAKVTLSVYDPICAHILPLERFLFVRYLGRPIFWGPILMPEWNGAAGTVTINAIDPSIRMRKHFVRIGDQAETDGSVTVDHRGIRILRDCALNIPAQTARGVPELGIVNGSNDCPNNDAHRYDTKRGDEVWRSIMNLTEQADGPDLDMDPQELDEGSYVHMDTYIKQGSDKTDTLKFHFNWGLDNCEDFICTPGGDAVVTHSHVLSADLKHRGTAAVPGPSARFGPYVFWDALDVNPVGADPNGTLAEWGKSRVLKYGEPPLFFTLQPKIAPDSGPMPLYGDDYIVGDIGKVVAKKGYMNFNIPARIRRVTLDQFNSNAGIVTPSIELVPRIIEAGDLDGEE